VPITGQTFAVLLTGALLGSRLGAMAMDCLPDRSASGLPFFYGAAAVSNTFWTNGWLSRRLFGRGL